MPDSSHSFSDVVQRLKLVLELASDAKLAEALGFTPQSWNKRKTRDSLPRKEIDALVTREQLNPEYVYEGKGAVHVPLEGEAWKAGLHARLKDLFGYETYVNGLIRNGYKAKELKAVADGKAPVTVELLRDLRLYLKADLHTVVCDEPRVTEEEALLLVRYRRAGAAGRKVIDAVALFAADVVGPSA